MYTQTEAQNPKDQNPKDQNPVTLSATASNIPIVLETGVVNLEPGVAISLPEQQAPKNKFSLFSTAFGTSIGTAVNFSVGAAIRHHPVHNGAITALTGGVIVGAIIGYIGGSLDIKEKNNTLKLALCGVLLEWAAALSALPLGTQVVPFQQDVSISTLIEDQFVGSAILTSPVIAMLILMNYIILVRYNPISVEQREAAREQISANLRNYFSTAELILRIADTVVVEEVPVITTLEATASDENLTSATMV